VAPAPSNSGSSRFVSLTPCRDSAGADRPAPVIARTLATWRRRHASVPRSGTRHTAHIADRSHGSDRPLTPPDHGYTPIAKVLHWTTVAALAAQITVGYALDVGGGRGRGRGRGGEPGRGRGRGDDSLDVFGDDGLITAHVVLGVSIVVLAATRVWWRRRAGLPPWAPSLSPTERTIAHWTERALYTLLFVVPLTGLWLVLVSDDAVAIHVAGHVALYAALTVHLVLVLKHQLIDRDGLLRRMT
jgi:cytochrome b561